MGIIKDSSSKQNVICLILSRLFPPSTGLRCDGGLFRTGISVVSSDLSSTFNVVTGYSLSIYLSTHLIYFTSLSAFLFYLFTYLIYQSAYLVDLSHFPENQFQNHGPIRITQLKRLQV